MFYYSFLCYLANPYLHPPKPQHKPSNEAASLYSVYFITTDVTMQMWRQGLTMTLAYRFGGSAMALPRIIRVFTAEFTATTFPPHISSM